MRPLPRTIVRVALLVVVVATAAGCTDPSPGTPPAKGAAGVPAFETRVTVANSTTLSASYRAGCPVGPSALRLVRLTYWGYDGQRKWGELVVAAGVVNEINAAFKRFYDARYQFASIRRVEAFGGSDDRSMAANNTSAFNCRRVTGGTAWSEHSYGTAIDVNPVQNPYVSGSTVLPPAGRNWLDRRNPAKEVIKAGDGWVYTFGVYGWKWGGSWTTKKDYQHFSKSGR
jgi:hypothetical protein